MNKTIEKIINICIKYLLIIFLFGVIFISCSNSSSLYGTYLQKEGVGKNKDTITINEDGTIIYNIGDLYEFTSNYKVERNTLFVSLEDMSDSEYIIKKNKLIFKGGIEGAPYYITFKKQNNKQYPRNISYNDLLFESPALFWGSSIFEVKTKYPNLEVNIFGGFYDDNNFHGEMESRTFYFYKNQLYMVNVTYGMYTEKEVEILKNELQEKYGIFLIKDDVSIKYWYIINEKNNQVVFSITYMGDYLINCIYINQQIKNESDTYSFLK
jgi:hypothetical protein